MVVSKDRMVRVAIGVRRGMSDALVARLGPIGGALAKGKGAVSAGGVLVYADVPLARLIEVDEWPEVEWVEAAMTGLLDRFHGWPDVRTGEGGGNG